MIAGLVLSFVLLVKGADFFVDGCVSIARLLRVPDLIIGLTIVAMGTSAPEAAVSISGAISSPEDAGITVGNLLGSNLLNILIILGISAVIVPIKVDPSLLKKDFPLLLGSGIIVPLLFWACGGSRLGGAVLLTMFIIFMVWTVMNALSSRKNPLPAEIMLLVLRKLPRSRCLFQEVLSMLSADLLLLSAAVSLLYTAQRISLTVSE